MRKAGELLRNVFSNQLGQDTLETLAYGGLAAGGQALFTDMTPEEIAIATSLGMGASMIGRPIAGRAGKYIGNQISNRVPNADAKSQKIIDFLVNDRPEGLVRNIMEAKLAPVVKEGLNPTAQLASMYGRGYGDNIAQGAFALASPLLFAGEDDA
jgi:hypothetical protein